MARISAVLLAGISYLAATPAWAGEDVLYGPPATWVVPADIAAARAANRPIVLLDRQVRMENGTVNGFSDVALRIDSPETLTAVGTPKLSWQPDKGDLTVHRLEILRGSEVIDLLADGARFSVLRRETGLESRSIDGTLTATMAVPGLKVGDILRYSQTITLRDQALGEEGQTVERLIPRPAQLGLGRVIVSWPEDEDFQWRVTRGAEVKPALRDGYQSLTVDLPLAELPQLPGDAPRRFSVAPLLQVGSFASWEEVSSRMAPLFATDGKITPGDAVDDQVQTIMRKTADPLERAALALRLVQDEVSYLMNGMNGGNYIPQDPQYTWQVRYGDCKAKTMLLLSMLRAMGISSEAVLVQTAQGDALPVLLPMPADFDHVIVRADIGGTEYWLDGTSGGTRLATIGEVPAFEHALPLREQGAGLMEIAQRSQDVPDRVLRFNYDLGAGIGMPILFDGEIELTGIMGLQVRSQVGERERSKVIDFARQYVKDLFPSSLITAASIAYDDDSGIGRIALEGILFNQWQFDGAEATYRPVLASTGLEFKPDRSRSSWRDIPVQLGGPSRFREEAKIRLPDAGEGYTQDGMSEFSGDVAGRRITRSMTRSGQTITISDDLAELPIEISAADFAAQRAAATRFSGGDPVVKAGREARRNWQIPTAELRQRLRRMELALTQVIAEKPDEAWRHAMRAAMRGDAFDLNGAVADWNRAIDLGATAQFHISRAQAYQALGKLALAREDAQAAYELQPDAASAMFLAQVEADAGNPSVGLALLDEVEASGDDRIGMMQIRAELSGQAGLLEQGWIILEDAVAERPGSPELLNSQCWYAASWQHRLEEAEDLCTRAVEASQWSAATLDSRALAYYRLGRPAEALADLDAALRNMPDIAASRYLRGIIRSEQGDQAGRQDIADALRQAPSISRVYGRFGVKPPA